MNISQSKEAWLQKPLFAICRILFCNISGENNICITEPSTRLLWISRSLTASCFTLSIWYIAENCRLLSAAGSPETVVPGYVYYMVQRRYWSSHVNFTRTYFKNTFLIQHIVAFMSNPRNFTFWNFTGKTKKLFLFHHFCPNSKNLVKEVAS